MSGQRQNLTAQALESPHCRHVGPSPHHSGCDSFPQPQHTKNHGHPVARVGVQGPKRPHSSPGPVALMALPPGQTVEGIV